MDRFPRSWRAIFFWPMILALARLSSSSVRPSLLQQVGLFQKFLFHQLNLFRSGADVEGEIAGRQPGEILRADVIGQTELLPDAHEQARAEIAARFLEQLQGVTVPIVKRRAAEANHDHGLFLVARLDDAIQFDWVRGSPARW